MFYRKDGPDSPGGEGGLSGPPGGPTLDTPPPRLNINENKVFVSYLLLQFNYVCTFNLTLCSTKKIFELNYVFSHFSICFIHSHILRPSNLNFKGLYKMQNNPLLWMVEKVGVGEKKKKILLRLRGTTPLRTVNLGCTLKLIIFIDAFFL